MTNSLEEHHPDTGTLFANWLSTEANEANRIKRDTPVMCILGNPPYNAESRNKGEWIMKLMEDYKKEPGNKEKLRERNPKSINDDYVKFLRYGQYFIEKNGSGILAFINPHSFMDNPTFRGIRWNLLKTYDKIYTIDLHGNSNKNETSPDGGIDQNVFDIMQGVSINIFIKTGLKKENELADCFHSEIYGTRDYKYDFLSNNSINNISWNKHIPFSPMYFLIPKMGNANVIKGFKLNELFPVYGMGIATGNDKELISFTESELISNFDTTTDIRFVKRISYRLFDTRYIYYDNSKVERGREKLMNNFLSGPNLGLISLKRARNNYTSKFGIVDNIVDKSIVSTLDNGYIFPLYLYPEEKNGILFEKSRRVPNLNSEILNEFEKYLAIDFTTEEITLNSQTFRPLDILDYIYSVLFSPTYREKNIELLKVDFPRIPYPRNINVFWKLVELGGELRKTHLLESSSIENYITQYPIDGDNIVGKPIYSGEKVYINNSQYFDHVPLEAWNLYIGGYQPAQKWLKDRRDRKLAFEDILHYQKIIVALAETARIMNEINKIEL